MTSDTPTAALLEGNVGVGEKGAIVSVKLPVPEPLTGLAVMKLLARFVSIRHSGSPQLAGDTVMENGNVPPETGTSSSAGETAKAHRGSG